ncbi:uncharacterized protein J7T54_004589 [Emericellopsis cladophorae]|uniref:Methyltransferase domain-containing protein n=1 Tax=Emericellopsis cladophorae TaxID=2686198 RepID=A0A9P9Y6M4_9HYPO|nr:uncharacterized protein J7T54_004589 [Emericellopsis cladophorae]KAI6784043.1 hypothetical protein J7T54_004589 [Emericellopsis cladophorae]
MVRPVGLFDSTQVLGHTCEILAGDTHLVRECCTSYDSLSINVLPITMAGREKTPVSRLEQSPSHSPLAPSGDLAPEDDIDTGEGGRPPVRPQLAHPVYVSLIPIGRGIIGQLRYGLGSGGEQSDDSNSTSSLRSSIFEMEEENGRYILPSDEGESERLDVQHEHFLQTFYNRLCFALGAPTAKRVLDAGTGTGIWAIDFDSTCAGRAMANQKSHLNPNGWVEMVDSVFPLGCDDGSLTPEHTLYEWSQLLLQASRKFGRSLADAKDHRQRLRDRGFINVVEKSFKWPTNKDWPSSKYLKNIGNWTHFNIDRSLEGLSMALLTRGHGWTQEEVLAYLPAVRKDMRDPTIKAYWHVLVVYGQKPDLPADDE